MMAAKNILLSCLITIALVASSAAQAAGSSKPPHVIGAGLGRTGTMSFKRALELLKVGPIFHMEDSFARIADLNPFWEELAQVAPVPRINNGAAWPPRLTDRHHPQETNKRVELLRTILGIQDNENKSMPTYHGTVDFPLCLYFLDLLQAYETGDGAPIKVILTSRETGAKWAKSALGSILNWHPSRRNLGVKVLFSTIYKQGDDMLQNTFFRFFPSRISDSEADFERMAQMHDSWNDYVRSSMAQYAQANDLDLNDIFLDYQVKEGWEPLCRFLQVQDCPEDEPFPHINDHESYQKALRDVNRMGWMVLAAFLVAPLAILALIRYIVQRYYHPKAEESSKKLE